MRAAHAACPGRTRTKKRPTKPATRKPSDLDKKLYRSPNATLSACRRSSTDHRAVCKCSNVLTCVGQAKNDLLLWRLAVRLDILWTSSTNQLSMGDNKREPPWILGDEDRLTSTRGA